MNRGSESSPTFFPGEPTISRNRLPLAASCTSATRPGSCSASMRRRERNFGSLKWAARFPSARRLGRAKCLPASKAGSVSFTAVNAETGELEWKQTIPGGWVWGSAAYDDGMVYVPTVNGYCVCLDAKNGHIVWMYPTAKSVPAEPAIDGDLVYFGSWSGSLYAFDKKTGEIVWKENGIGLDSGTLIAYEGKIYLPHHSSVFMYFDARTGEILSHGNQNPKHTGNFSNFNATPAFFQGPRLLHGARGHWYCAACRPHRASTASIRPRQKFTGPSRMAVDFLRRRSPPAASTSAPATHRISIASMRSPENRNGSTSSVSVSKKPRSAFIGTKSTSSRATATCTQLNRGDRDEVEKFDTCTGDCVAFRQCG